MVRVSSGLVSCLVAWELALDFAPMDFIKSINNRRVAEEDALKVFRKVEEKGLNHTGKSHYEMIAESLDLMRRINPIRSHRIADQIRD